MYPSGWKTLCLAQKNSEKNICFPWKKLFFLPTVEKTTIFSSGNKSSPQSFSVPGIMFPARRNIQGGPYVSERFFKNGCGIEMSQATPTKFSMLFKHNYGKLFWKFGDHSFNFSFVHGPSWLRVLESIHRFCIIFTFWKKNQKVIVRPCLMSQKIYFIDF